MRLGGVIWPANAVPIHSRRDGGQLADDAVYLLVAHARVCVDGVALW